MGQKPMFVSVPTADGRWFAVRVRHDGHGLGPVPGVFDTKVEADERGKRDVGFRV